MFVNVDDALLSLSSGKIIAYPTEGVFGLGCDPHNDSAIKKLLALKKREHSKGLIVLINQFSQLNNLVSKDFAIPFETLNNYWPGHFTFLFPKNPKLSPLLTGVTPKIAIRLTNHPIASALCNNGPIVSTSANLTGMPALMSPEAVASAFGDMSLCIVKGSVGGLCKPSQIIDLISGDVIRP